MAASGNRVTQRHSNPVVLVLAGQARILQNWSAAVAAGLRFGVDMKDDSQSVTIGDDDGAASNEVLDPEFVNWSSEERRERASDHVPNG